MIFICPITDDAHFDQLIKGMSARFCYCKVILSPFVVSKYFVEKHFETINSSSDFNCIHLLLYTSVDSWNPFLFSEL